MNQEVRITNQEYKKRDHNSYFIIRNSNSGYIALITILLISAVTLATATTIGLLAIGEAQSAVAVTEGDETLSFVEGCMEDALLKARSSDTYTGGSLTRPEGTCTITVSKAGNIWTITATTTATQFKRTVQVRATKGTMMTLHSWNEI